MNIPSKVRIFNRDIDIIIDNDICAQQKAIGYSIYTQNKIYLATQTTKDGKTEEHSHDSIITTLYHEIIHFMLYLSGVDNFLSPKQREAVCDAIGTALTDTVEYLK